MCQGGLVLKHIYTLYNIHILGDRERKRDNDYRTNYVEGLLPVHIGGHDKRVPGVGGVVHSKVRQLQEALLTRHRLASGLNFAGAYIFLLKFPHPSESLYISRE